MRKFLFSILILSASSSAFAFECSQLPKQGPVSATVVLADGTTALFKANLSIEKIVTGFDERKTTHTYKNPQVFVGNKEVALAEDALDDIAQMLGYDFAGFRDVQANAGYFRKRQILTTNGQSFVIEKAPRESIVVSPKGGVKFFQADCADWAFN